MTLPLIAQLGSGASLQPPTQVKPFGLPLFRSVTVAVGSIGLAVAVEAGITTVGMAATNSEVGVENGVTVGSDVGDWVGCRVTVGGGNGVTVAVNVGNEVKVGPDGRVSCKTLESVGVAVANVAETKSTVVMVAVNVGIGLTSGATINTALDRVNPVVSCPTLCSAKGVAALRNIVSKLGC